MDETLNFEHIIRDQISIPKKLLSSYKHIGLNEQDLVVILQIHRFLQEGKEFPTLAEISNSLTINEQNCAIILRKLIQNELLVIQSKVNEQNQLSEVYSLEPLWKKLRSEEHTSELQSRGHLVCRLLLEKKKRDNF